MNTRTLALWTLLALTAAGRPSFAARSDADALREMLGLAAAGDAADLKSRLESVASRIEDPATRQKAVGVIPSLVDAAGAHARAAAAAKAIAAIGAKATFQ